METCEFGSVTRRRPTYDHMIGILARIPALCLPPVMPRLAMVLPHFPSAAPAHVPSGSLVSARKWPSSPALYRVTADSIYMGELPRKRGPALISPAYIPRRSLSALASAPGVLESPLDGLQFPLASWPCTDPSPIPNPIMHPTDQCFIRKCRWVTDAHRCATDPSRQDTARYSP